MGDFFHRKLVSQSYDITIILSSTVIAFVTGYFLGAKLRKPTAAAGNEYNDIDDELSGKFLPFSQEACKLVLCVRQDLGMGKGKAAAQCGHATLSSYKLCKKRAPQLLKQWERYGQTKVALKISSEDEINELYSRAVTLGLVATVVQDAGRTQIAAGSRTVLAIGPGPEKLIDSVTGHLKLY